MNLPLDFKARMKNMLHDEYEAFSAAFSNNPEYRGVRITKPSAEDMVISKLGLHRRVPWCKNGFYVDKSAVSGNHPYHIAGLLYFQEPSAMAPVSALPIEPGDYVLLCTDGLIETATDKEMEEEILRGGDPNSCMDRLLDLAKRRGAADNVTAVLLKQL